MSAPTLFDDARLAQLGQQCLAALAPAAHLHSLVLNLWHMVQEVQQGRQREQQHEANAAALREQIGQHQQRGAALEQALAQTREAAQAEITKLRQRLTDTEQTLAQVQATANHWHDEVQRLQALVPAPAESPVAEQTAKVE